MGLPIEENVELSVTVLPQQIIQVRNLPWVVTLQFHVHIVTTRTIGVEAIIPEEPNDGPNGLLDHLLIPCHFRVYLEL
jgi:hypothetical protein